MFNMNKSVRVDYQVTISGFLYVEVPRLGTKEDQCKAISAALKDSHSYSGYQEGHMDDIKINRWST